MGRFVPARKVILLLLAVLILICLSVAFSASRFAILTALAQNSANSSSQTTPRKTSPPYTGDLSIFEDKERDKKLQVERVMDILGIKEGAYVADIGAGSGWFTVRAAKRVGSTGIVYAVDINPESIAYINRRTQREGIGNVQQSGARRMIPGCRKTALIPCCC
ncbi:MAG: Methyltransferase type 11 [Candidatus Angelobacter sp.]|nr:Methyltransferase type 11 [Candidatus Angelobacter sp.]